MDVVAKDILLLEEWIWNTESFPCIIFCTPNHCGIEVSCQCWLPGAGFNEMELRRDRNWGSLGAEVTGAWGKKTFFFNKLVVDLVLVFM